MRWARSTSAQNPNLQNLTHSLMVFYAGKIDQAAQKQPREIHVKFARTTVQNFAFVRLLACFLGNMITSLIQPAVQTKNGAQTGRKKHAKQYSLNYCCISLVSIINNVGEPSKTMSVHAEQFRTILNNIASSDSFQKHLL